MPDKTRPPPARAGIHINDPTDDPTRLLVHYDGRVWPALLVAGLLCGILGYIGGLWMGTDHYTMSTVCSPEDAR
ncbi:MAG: hypothetical protein VW516_05940 [Rhodospirillaceae bacterium]|jgi:hypothetical protein